MARVQESWSGLVLIGVTCTVAALVVFVFAPEFLQGSRRGVPMWVVVPVLLVCGIACTFRGLRLRRDERT